MFIFDNQNAPWQLPRGIFRPMYLDCNNKYPNFIGLHNIFSRVTLDLSDSVYREGRERKCFFSP